MLWTILRTILRDIFGGGSDISASNPIPVSSSGQSQVDPYTGTGNIVPGTVKTTAIIAFRALRVSIHWSAATSSPVTISLDANAGAAYDTVLHIETLGANTDMVHYFPEGAKFEAGDVITVAWTDDTGGVATWGVQIAWE